MLSGEYKAFRILFEVYNVMLGMKSIMLLLPDVEDDVKEMVKVAIKNIQLFEQIDSPKSDEFALFTEYVREKWNKEDVRKVLTSVMAYEKGTISLDELAVILCEVVNKYV